MFFYNIEQQTKVATTLANLVSMMLLGEPTLWGGTENLLGG